MLCLTIVEAEVIQSEYLQMLLFAGIRANPGCSLSESVRTRARRLWAKHTPGPSKVVRKLGSECTVSIRSFITKGYD